MTIQRTLMMCLGFAVVMILGIAFVMVPVGWKFLPLFFGALVIAGMAAQLRVIFSVRGDASAGAPTTDTVEEAPAEAVPDVKQGSKLVRRANRVFGPIVAGMIIDLVDFSTFGPVGLVLGLPIGGLAGYWMGRALGFGRRGAVWCAVAAGVYCTIPGTEVIPLATIVGACARFRDRAEPEEGKAATKAPKS